MIIGISGKKQSGKSTSGNFFYSLMMIEAGICRKAIINPQGQIEISDLFGDKNYAGIFDPCYRLTSDWNIKKVFQELDQVIALYNFADMLKQNICIDILGMTYNQCYGSDDDKNQITDIEWEGQQLTAREVMQLVGTDIFRKLKTDVWAESTLNKIQKDNPKIAIITDCRFPNEVDAIKKRGGKVIRLTKKYDSSTHPSETILDDNNYDWNNFDYIIDNQNMSIYDQCLELQNILNTQMKESV